MRDAKAISICCLTGIMTATTSNAFSQSATFIIKSTSKLSSSTISKEHRNKDTKLYILPPPGSGYFSPEDEVSVFPDTYEPMMEYPGTMRPGRTPENQPYSSLPIQSTDPDPVPWPHFQEIEWHHNWGSPHEHAIPMEEFIDMHGRWATVEMEAEMRAGARRGVRERRELEEAQKESEFILDDDDDDDEDEGPAGGVQLQLGQGVDALIGTELTGAAVATGGVAKDVGGAAAAVEEEEVDDDDDDFLLDLGLDGGDDSEDDSFVLGDDKKDDDDGEEPAFATSQDSSQGILEAMQTMIDAEDDDSSESSVEVDVDVDDLDFDELGLSFEDDDADATTDDSDKGSNDDDSDFILNMMDGDDQDSMGDEQDIVPLDDMIGNEDMGDDDAFDDGGFDYD